MKSGKLKIRGKMTEIFFPEGLEKDFECQKYEIWGAECYKNGLKKDGIYIDAGANMGMSVLYFLDHAKKIYALEPNPEIFKALKKNVGHYDNVEIFNIGLAPSVGKDFLYSSKGEDIPQTLFGGITSIRTADALFTTLDKFMEKNKISHVDVLKLDIESSEYIVLPSDGFGKATKNIDYIIGEGHFRDGIGSPDLIPVILSEWGYETNTIKYKSNYKNASRKCIFTDPVTGVKKEYERWFNTMFEAKKKK